MSVTGENTFEPGIVALWAMLARAAMDAGAPRGQALIIMREVVGRHAAELPSVETSLDMLDEAEAAARDFTR